MSVVAIKDNKELLQYESFKVGADESHCLQCDNKSATAERFDKDTTIPLFHLRPEEVVPWEVALTEVELNLCKQEANDMSAL